MCIRDRAIARGEIENIHQISPLSAAVNYAFKISNPVTLSIEKLQTILEELMEASATEAFKSKIDSAATNSDGDFNLARRELMAANIEMQMRVLRRHDLDGLEGWAALMSATQMSGLGRMFLEKLQKSQESIFNRLQDRCNERAQALK
eukprot:TRINITY_DN2196_c0_g1_i2.p1 TRINITY_DN2196_c0_g1~~TRINITY_DN2196_c0_g1_i2.p1  ORF type:complete len:148 (-),score=30.64 TRINITY_DN2196_c0_g1_i2:27-470(-)